MVFIYLENRLSNSIESKVVEIDGMHYIIPTFTSIKSDPKDIKNIGSKLACESVGEILNQHVKHNMEIPGSKSFLTGNPLQVDCFDPSTKIMVDYNTENFYSFKGSDRYNKDFYEFYDRLALDSLKKEKIKELGYEYIEVPYTTDLCKKDEKTNRIICNEKTSNSERKIKIKEYIRQQLINIF